VQVEVQQVKNDSDFAICMAIRMEVFVFEQGVAAEEEWDAHDKEAVHFFARVDGKPAATARLRELDGIAKLERMAVRAAFRGKGVGDALLNFVMDHARSMGLKRAKLSAQTHALEFYEKLGFEIVSDEYIEAGIPHKAMERDL